MEKRSSPVMVAQSSGQVLGTPITSLPAFTPLSIRRGSSAHSRGSSMVDGKACPVAGASDGLPTMLLTPSFANRGFVTRFSPLGPAAARDGPARTERGHQLIAALDTAATPLTSAKSGTAISSQARQVSPLLWEQHGRRLSAPSGYTDTAASEAATPSFQIQAPSGLTDSEGESDGEGGQEADSGASWDSRRRGSLGAAGLRPLSPAEVALAELTARLEAQLQVQGQLRVARLERTLLELDAEELEAQLGAQRERQKQQAEVAKADEAQRAQQAQQRQQLLAKLRAEHDQKSREAQDQLAKKEEAARAEAQRQKREAQRRQQEAQQAQQEAAEAQRAEQAAAQAQAQAQEASRKTQDDAAVAAAAALEAQAKQKAAEAATGAEKDHHAAAAAAAAAGVVAPPQEPFPERVSPSAAQWRLHCAERLKAAQDLVRPFVEDRAMKDKKRSIDKFVTLNVQQIAATLDQVRAKGLALVHFMSQQQGAQRAYALLTLANKLLSQCEAQVTRLHPFAFPLAEVAVAVASAHPEFVELLVGRLHQVCILSVPQYYSFKQGGNEDEYLKKMGYKFVTDEDTGQVTKESTDDFVGRMQGYVLLLAAVTQSDNPANPHGLAQAWAYIARLLNALPANRITATALDAFLKVAGYRLHGTYRGQFMKLLRYIDSEFLGHLSKQNDPDARAVFTRIQTYLKTGRFMRPPEGRDMPQSDASSYDRA
ncbi:hypothetical protein N2152v2_010678 [Parachlorella kessleri]